MGRVTLEDKFINFVRNAVDLSVGNTGYPVIGKHLEESHIATRKQLRAMEKKGLLKTIRVRSPKGVEFMAYYTERNIPKWVQKQEGTSSEE